MKKTLVTTVKLLHTVKQEGISPTFLHKLTSEDKAADPECVEAYGSFIWSLAIKFTNSEVEAEAAVREIFIDIWRYKGRKTPRTSDELLRSLIARRRLIKSLQNK